VIRPAHIGAFEFVVLASLRTAQLTRGCTPKMPTDHKHAVTAQREIAAGLVTSAGPGSAEAHPGSTPPTPKP
jgi:DNA-directed RNA polymerase subunit K/omega